MNKVRLILILLCVVIISCGTSNDSNNDNGDAEHKILKFSGAYDPVMRCVTLDWILNPEWLTEQPHWMDWLDMRGLTSLPIPKYTVYRSDGASRDVTDTHFVNCSNDPDGWDFDHLPYDYDYSYDVSTCFFADDGSGICTEPENGFTAHITPIPEDGPKVTGSYDPVSRCVTLELALTLDPLESVSLPKYEIERWEYISPSGIWGIDMGRAETTNSSFTHCSDDEVLGFDVRDNKIVYPKFYYRIFASVDGYNPITGEKVSLTYVSPYFLPDNIWSYPYTPDLSGTYPISMTGSAHSFIGASFTAGNAPKSSLDREIEAILRNYFQPAPDGETLIFTTAVVENGDNSTAYAYVKDKSFSYTTPTIIFNKHDYALTLASLMHLPFTEDTCMTGTYTIKDKFDDNGMYIGSSGNGRFDADCNFPSNINISKPQ